MRILRIGGYTPNDSNTTQEIEIATLEDLREKVRELNISVPAKIKLSAQWGRKWIEYIGTMPDGQPVFLDNGKW